MRTHLNNNNTRMYINKTNIELLNNYLTTIALPEEGGKIWLN
jgi:hypothetical protein